MSRRYRVGPYPVSMADDTLMCDAMFRSHVAEQGLVAPDILNLEVKRRDEVHWLDRMPMSAIWLEGDVDAE